MLAYHPKIIYDVAGDRKYVTDIFRRIVMSEKLRDNTSLFQRYAIQDGETAQEAAKALYGDESKDWLLYLINDIIDPYTGWCMSYDDLRSYVDAKYEDPDAVHHYVAPGGYWSDTGTPVSNFEHESELNEQRRFIRVLRPEFVSRFVDQYKSLARS